MPYGHMSCKISFAKSIAFMTMVNKFAQLKKIQMRQTWTVPYLEGSDDQKPWSSQNHDDSLFENRG